MRRHLVLVRHAKSAWDQPASGDHDRRLADRGRAALPLMNDHLAASTLRPDLVWCSSAQRTIETLAGIRSALPDQADVDTDPNLYNADDATVLDRLRQLGDDVECAMIVGHNPTMQRVALLLAAQTGGPQTGDAEAYRRVQSKVPTGAIMTLSFDGSWSDLTPGSAHLDDLFTPRPPQH